MVNLFWVFGFLLISRIRDYKWFLEYKVVLVVGKQSDIVLVWSEENVHITRMGVGYV